MDIFHAHIFHVESSPDFKFYTFALCFVSALSVLIRVGCIPWKVGEFAGMGCYGWANCFGSLVSCPSTFSRRSCS